MIRKLFSFQLAGRILLGINLAVIVFHLLVLFQVVPYEVVWGGRLRNIEEMRVFEAISIAVNVFLVTVVITKAGWIKTWLSTRMMNGILWFFVVLFTLNTIGNLNAISSLEMIIATPLTALSALLCWRMAIE